MDHICDAGLITCEYFRLQQRKDGCNYVAEFIKSFDVIVAEFSFEDKFSDSEEIFLKINEVIWLY